MTEEDVAQAYRAYAGAMYARGLRLLRDSEASRDVTQEVFIRCLAHRRELRVGSELLAWLYRVTTNLCLNAIRDGKVRARTAQDSAWHAPAAAAPEGPARRGLWDLLSGLGERTQAIVVYVYIDGMTHAEAAFVAKVSDRTVRNCLARFQEHARTRVGTLPEPLLRGEC
jgi:RNA polymerase sigma-70 factor, ECF subfamily